MISVILLSENFSLIPAQNIDKCLRGWYNCYVIIPMKVRFLICRVRVEVQEAVAAVSAAAPAAEDLAAEVSPAVLAEVSAEVRVRAVLAVIITVLLIITAPISVGDSAVAVITAVAEVVSVRFWHR